MWMQPDEVVACSLKNLQKSGLVIPGWQNRLFAFFMRRPMFAPIVRLCCRLNPEGRASLAAAEDIAAADSAAAAAERSGTLSPSMVVVSSDAAE
jgi:hypothetical protein